MGDYEGSDPSRGLELTVFVDTAILMYAGGREHPLREPCRRILRLFEGGRLDATISAEVVQEILHRFSALRQPQLGAEMARSALDLFAPVLPITHAVMERVPALVERYQDVSARDLLHVATCLEGGIPAIVTPDRGFDRLPEVIRVPPEEEMGLQAYLR